MRQALTTSERRDRCWRWPSVGSKRSFDGTESTGSSSCFGRALLGLALEHLCGLRRLLLLRLAFGHSS